VLDGVRAATMALVKGDAIAGEGAGTGKSASTIQKATFRSRNDPRMARKNARTEARVGSSRDDEGASFPAAGGGSVSRPGTVSRGGAESFTIGIVVLNAGF
jgi:hypothetical protein